ncbi:MAG: EAL domain-containing protein [Agathobacter sp.]|nr:EAL domain-containing protein [Agathobacter sp.]MBQ6812248.1 EAL domain-containing protein [Agathobacter sp.]
MQEVIFYNNYYPAGDVITLALCIVVGFLMQSTYTMKRTNLKLFKRANLLVAIAAMASLMYHMMLKDIEASGLLLLYTLRGLANSALVWTYVCFCVYIANVVELECVHKKKFYRLVFGAATIFTIMEFAGPYFEFTFYIDETLQIHQKYALDIFHWGYMFFSLVLFLLIFKYKKKMIKKIRVCLGSVMGLCFFIMVYQTIRMQASYSAATFAFPLVAVLFLFHYNAYDVDTGTLDQYAFDEFLEDSRDKHYSMIILSLPNISHDKMQKMSYDFIRKNNRYFENSYCFRLRNNRIILAYQKEKNKSYKDTLQLMYQDFLRINEKEKNEYRIIILDYPDAFAHGTEALYFCEYMEMHMSTNGVMTCQPEDIQKFHAFKELFRLLKEMSDECNLNDPRIKVYCQPVLDLKTNKFTTAEALMRLELPGMGQLCPDQFIPMLEERGLIHSFSKIILNKTCKEIKKLEEEGYHLSRVSVNFSVQELQLDSFCDDIVKIIRDNGIELSKIAIEITESKNEKDFMMMKRVLEELKQHGMKFYLDDFGTGYSNFERIIELPVDTIKFDRSLTILASKDDESKFMVGSFSEIFKRANYQILFEGVESETDEIQCKDMNAQYLQGFRYSRPIPMEQLREFLEKK